MLAVIKEEIEKASAVFTGKVVISSDIITRIRIEQVWKGYFQNGIAVVNENTNYVDSCDYSFKSGETYLVFAYKQEGTLRVRKCSLTGLLQNSDRVLKLIGDVSGKDK